jgi:iron complex outermembrane receptor protein
MIATLTVGLLLFTYAVAAQDSQKVVVTGTWTPIPLNEADRSITLLPVTAQTSRLTTAWIDLLRLEPSLDLQQRVPNGVLTDLSIRGSSFGQTLVLLNGLRLNDAQTGHFNMNLPVPLEAIDRIEVLKGAGSLFYGSDAVGGVVNVITNTPERRSLRIRTALGSFGAQQQRVDFGSSNKLWSQRLVVARDFSTGFISNRDFRSLSGAYDLRLRSRLGSTSVLLASADRAFGAEQFYGNFPSWERTKTWWAGIRQELGSKTEASFAFRRGTDLFVLYRDRPELYTNHHAGETYQAALRRVETLNSNTRLSYGVEGLRDTLNSTNLGNRTRDRGAAYVGLDVRALHRFSLTLGTREELYTGGGRQFNPTAAAGYWLSRGWKLKASASRAFRLPTFTDLYYRDPANVGNPMLRPERAWNFEGAVQWVGLDSLRVELTVFQRRERDGIDYFRRTPTDTWTAANFQRLRFSGVEAALAWTVRRGQTFEARHTSIRGSQESLSGLESKYVFNYPTEHSVFSWQGTLPFKTVARARLGRLGRVRRAAYSTLDLFVASQRGRFIPFIQMLNAADARYEEIPNVTMPGRTFLGGVELRVW